ncbi:MAG: hypothetical protein IKM97_01240 [Clostridia bacterium]|nr:hypothetical protein [Clostridia bacterium]
MKKISILGLCLLILAGIVVVLFRGFNVNSLLEQHEVIELVIGKDFELADVNNICKDVFKNKKAILRKIELFNDSVAINVSSITNEEKDNLIEKINNKFETNIDVSDVEIKTIAKVRIRDWVKPYIKPITISAVIILAYICVRFKKENLFLLIGKIIGILLITILVLLSIFAIFRIPMSPIYITLITSVALIELIIYIKKIGQ